MQRTDGYQAIVRRVDLHEIALQQVFRASIALSYIRVKVRFWLNPACSAPMDTRRSYDASICMK